MEQKIRYQPGSRKMLPFHPFCYNKQEKTQRRKLNCYVVFITHTGERKRKNNMLKALQHTLLVWKTLSSGDIVTPVKHKNDIIMFLFNLEK